jgi:hypothetical protein
MISLPVCKTTLCINFYDTHPCLLYEWLTMSSRTLYELTSSPVFLGNYHKKYCCIWMHNPCAMLLVYLGGGNGLFKIIRVFGDSRLWKQASLLLTLKSSDMILPLNIFTNIALLYPTTHTPHHHPPPPGRLPRPIDHPLHYFDGRPVDSSPPLAGIKPKGPGLLTC